MKTFIVSIILGLFPLSMMAQWYPLNNEQKIRTAPVVQILSDDANSTVIKVEISGFELKEFYSGTQRYQSIDLRSEGSSSLIGSPDLPYISKILAIPDKAGVSVEVIETSGLQTFQNINLPPCRESWFEGKPETSYIEDKGLFSSADIFPDNLVSIGTPMVFRDFRVVRLSVYPIRYIASKKELQVMSSITIKINYNSEKAVNPKTRPTTSIAPSFEKIYESFIFNYESALSRLGKGAKSGRDVMLCIMPDAFVSDFQVYADWKRQSGIDVHITKFSDIGATANDQTIIKNHIADAYHNWEYPPTYVLLVGDYGVLPEQIVNYDYSFPNEDYFVEIDGSDFLPEMMIGRFPVQTNYALNVMISKAMSYEKFPNTTNTDWFKKGVCCSNNEYPSQIETKRFTAKIMLEDGGFSSVDTLMSDAGCTMDLNDVIQTINNGRSFLNYRGEGWYYGWWAYCYPFNTSDVSSINNGTKLTFVTSIGCGVAMFDTPGGNCFGEEWVKLGTPTSLRGAIAFIGATSNSHTQYNNMIDKGLYVGMFREGLETPGQGLLRGKFLMYQTFGAADPWVEYHYRLFCILGDPSVHIWKEIPLAVNVNHPASVPLAYSDNIITVTYSSTLLPVYHAQVTITGDSVFASGYTDSTGKVTLGITPVSLDSLIITVRGMDVIPYQGKIGISTSSVPDLSGDINEFGLGKIFPNPFDQSTVINYSIPEQCNISLKVFDIDGRLIKVLFDGKQRRGSYSVLWHGDNDAGNQVNAGMYFIKFTSNDLKQTVKVFKSNTRCE
jgi:hypothetical protein